VNDHGMAIRLPVTTPSRSTMSLSVLFVLLIGGIESAVQAFAPTQTAHRTQTEERTKCFAAPSFSLDSLLSSVNLENLPQDLDDRMIGLVVGVPLALVLLPTLISPPRLIQKSTLDSIVEGTFLENKDLTCVYKASKDGWSAIDFHDAVDNKGSAVVVGRTLGGKLFGGFNPAGWRSTDDYTTSTAAFLWAAKGGFLGSGDKVIKFPILAGGNAATFDYATGGPCFGAADLLIGPPKAAVMGGFAGPDMENISINAGNLRNGKSSFGTYDLDERWPVRGNFGLVELEVYCDDR